MLGDVLSDKEVDPASVPTVSVTRLAFYTFLISLGLIVMLCVYTMYRGVRDEREYLINEVVHTGPDRIYFLECHA